MEENVYIKDFELQLNKLRQEKSISARDLSISIGKSHNFVFNVESHKNFPTMLNFFYLCEQLNISPYEFFEYTKTTRNEKINNILHELYKLNSEEIDVIADIISHISKNK